jgi:hypothetical protein
MWTSSSDPPAAEAASDTVTLEPAALAVCVPSAGVGACHETTTVFDEPDHGRADAVPAPTANTTTEATAPATRT